jgi:quercetin dioxygenase-like cupin family protein
VGLRDPQQGAAETADPTPGLGVRTRFERKQPRSGEKRTPDGRHGFGVVEGAAMSTSQPTRKPIVLRPGGGRDYPMGRIRAVFKADGDETAQAYSISEWWLDANTKGPGAHSHPEDDVFYVIEGTMSLMVGQEWIDAPAGSFVLVPGGVTHDFENRGDRRAGILNFTPGVFETEMEGIAEWFAKHPPGNAR